jgi:hypothetical protein
MPPAAQAGVTQAGATALALLPVVAGLEVTLAQWAVVQAAVALRIATLTGAATLVAAVASRVRARARVGERIADPGFAWGAAFVILAAIYGGTFRTQVPLFLTGASVRATC